MKKVFEPLTGVILSIASWETWENILLSIFIALVGGFMASVGKGIHLKLKKCYIRRKQANEKRISNKI